MGEAFLTVGVDFGSEAGPIVVSHTVSETGRVRLETTGRVNFNPKALRLIYAMQAQYAASDKAAGLNWRKRKRLARRAYEAAKREWDRNESLTAVEPASQTVPIRSLAPNDATPYPARP